MASSIRGTSGVMSQTAGAGIDRCCRSRSLTPGPGNGGVPVRHSNSRMPTAYRSERSSGCRREQTGRLGREVAHGADQVFADGLVEVRAAGEAEVDQGHGLDRVGASDDDVGRLHVAMDDARVVRHVQRPGDVDADPEHGLDRQTGRT